MVCVYLPPFAVDCSLCNFASLSFLLFSQTAINNSCAGLLNKNVILKYNITWLNILGLDIICQLTFQDVPLFVSCFSLSSLYSCRKSILHIRYPLTRLFFISTCKVSFSAVFIQLQPRMSQVLTQLITYLLASTQTVSSISKYKSQNLNFDVSLNELLNIIANVYSISFYLNLQCENQLTSLLMFILFQFHYNSQRMKRVDHD